MDQRFRSLLYNVSLLCLAAPAAAQEVPRPTLAIAPLTSAATAEYQWIGAAFADSLAFRAQQMPALNTLTLRQVNAALRESGLQTDSLVRAEAAIRVGRILGADLLVTGTYDASWPTIEIVLNFYEPNAKKLRVTRVIEGSLDDLFALEALVAQLVAKEVRVPGFAVARAAFGTATLLAWRNCTEAFDILNWQSLSPRAADPTAPPQVSASQLDEAHHHLSQAVALDPSYARAWAGLVVIEALAGNMEGAQQASDRASHAGGFQPTAVLATSFVHVRRGQLDQAAEILRLALIERPGFLHARGYLGELLALQKKHKEALAVFDDYLREVPHQPWVLVQRGYSKSKLGDRDGAIADTQEALGIVPGAPAFRIELASRYIDAGRLQEARVVLVRLLAEHPDMAVAYTRLGYVYLLLGEDRPAITVSDKAVSYGNYGQRRRDLAYAHLNLARAHGHRGAIDRALQHLEKAVSLAQISLDDVERDPKLDVLRKDARYTALLARQPHANP